MRANQALAEASGRPGHYFEVLLAAAYGTLLKGRAGVAMDGGTNAGLHAVGMIKAFGGTQGRVVGFEPQPTLASQARGWARAHGAADRLELHEAALGAAEGRTRFFVNKTDTALSGLRMMKTEEELYDEREVAVVTLDTLAADRLVQFVKLDLEGGEYHALLGAERTIARCRPIVAFENGIAWSANRFGYQPNAVPLFFERQGYEIFDFYGNAVTPDSYEFPGQTFMFFAGPHRDFRLMLVRDMVDEFWAWSDSLDLSSWDRTIDEVIARAEGTPGDNGA
ncbi:MAG: FkbM family methyltransferase [Alphaproteobacteria bacterium]|nr:FkbM family methyltransferase [Alphaproteobacteria bacterium]